MFGKRKAAARIGSTGSSVSTGSTGNGQGKPGDAPAELLDELAEAGYPAPSLTELRTSGLKYREAVPVLCAWLPRLERPNQRESALRALTYRWAAPDAVQPLITEFRRTDEIGERHRWTVGNALEVMAADAYYDDLVELALDPAFGTGRQMVVLGLARCAKSPGRIDVLTSLLDDPDVSGHAASALAKIADPGSRATLESLLDDERAWVRKDVRRGLDKIDAAQS